MGLFENIVKNTIKNTANSLTNAIGSIDENNTSSPIMSFGGGFGESKFSLNPTFMNSTQAQKINGYSNNKKFNIEAIKTKFYKDNSSNLYISPFNISNYDDYEQVHHVNKSVGQAVSIDKSGKKNFFFLKKNENPFELSSDVLTSFNNYRFKYKNELYTYVSAYDSESTGQPDVHGIKTKVVPSLFSPNNMIQNIGITSNVPLTSDHLSSLDTSPINANMDPSLSVCTIKELVNLSKQRNSILGNARYTYADFMYCKDLGKVSNNHLLTLRRFAYPIGDNIFESSTLKYKETRISGDIGRLIAWFDTEDNKLDNILRYSYNSTWKPVSSTLESVNSQEDDDSRGPIGRLINTFSLGYNKSIAQGYSPGTNSFWNYIGVKRFDNNQIDRQRMFEIDKNKIYTPKNTVQDTNLYEGKLEFSHEFTLTFSYKLRAYDNVNPKSAMLDLIGNILNVTYNRGRFWGGERRMIGPPQDLSSWNKANAMIDNAWDKLGGFFESLANLDDLSSLLASMSGALGNIVKSFQNAINTATDTLTDGGTDKSAKGIFQKSLNVASDYIKKHGWDQTAKGLLKNQLGRPAFYAMQSLLSGEDVGLWHLTIGNPKNPIAVMGNLILTKSEITHSGPLGIDDFPTEIKVTCTLKHARSRDLTEISRMYTKGLSAIHFRNKYNSYSDFMATDASSTKDNKNKAQISYEEFDTALANVEMLNDSDNDYRFNIKFTNQEAFITGARIQDENA